MQLPFGFTIPQVAWTPPDLRALPSWADAKRVSVDVETKDPDLQKRPGHEGLGPGDFRPGNWAVGISFAIEDGPSHYLPIRHEGGDNVDCDHALQYVRDQARVFRGTLVGTNLAYDEGFLYRDDIEFKNVAWHRDVQNAAVLIYELYDRYNLTAIAERLGLPGKDDSVLKAFAQAYGCHPKRDLYKLPGRAVAQYAVQDVVLPLTILRRQEKQIDELEIQQVWDMESRLLPVLLRMRRRGVKVNLDKVRKIEEWCLAQERQLLNKAHTLSGVQLAPDDVWNASAMSRPLTACGYTVPMSKDKKPRPSVDKHFLTKCGEIGATLKRAREVNKLRTTYAHRIWRYHVNGRVHPVTHQMRRSKDEEKGDDDKGVRYGRTAMEHHSMQQEPGRDDEFGSMWRSVYEAEDDCFWVCSDWSQQEPRIGVHYAEILGLPGAKEFADEYRRNPRLDIHQALADISGMARKIVKNFVNGRLYGMGDAKLCRSIGCPTKWTTGRDGKEREVPGEDGQAKIDQFNKFVPWLVLLTRECAKQAKKKGHVWTADRRRCNFPKDSQGNYDWVHKAFSRVGQGSAAGQFKETAIAADAEGIPLQLGIHDEFDYSENDPRRMRRLKELQLNVRTFGVPMMVDQEVGPDWGAIHKTSSPEGVAFLARWENFN